MYATVFIQDLTGDKEESEKIKIVIDRIRVYNKGFAPVVGLSGIDPPTWWLRRGNALGLSYTGNAKIISLSMISNKRHKHRLVRPPSNYSL